MSTMPPPHAEPTRHDPDVLVIGGGIVGLFCAYHLRRAGVGVTVLERGPVGGPMSCSYGNTGFVGTQGSTPLAEPGVPAQGLRWLLNPESPFYIRPRWDGELLRWLWHFRRACNEHDARAGFGVLVDLKKRSLDILRELCAAGDLAPFFTAQGMVLAYNTPQGFDKACRSVPEAVAHGVPLRVLGPGELDALEPDTEFDVHGALYNEEGAYLRVPDFLVAFARMLEGMGVEIHPHTEAVGFEVAGREVRRVRTTRGDFHPREVVVAAGTWSAECARRLGVGLMLQPAKGYSVTVKAPRDAPRRPLLLGEGKVALVPLGDRLRFGGTLELSGMDATISRRRVDGILRTVRTYLPRLETTETVETWSGFRPCTPDGIPLIGRAEPYRNLCVASGHGHIGMGLAPAGGKLIAQIITGERPDIDPAPFRVGRHGGRTRRRTG
ncbi:D-amino-acid dehydrogenase [Streptosporangium becharense]|uniref:D-amino-acid dehydrogenase n=1 Tax=Streptosporangium becharense TaxID=1816182 RepID=A0A7W9IPD0_9ACTN|nr:FAD-dependent oxidoreductase [Streptosporangium becharense]MBB2915380.1 D-amino-acid dehydrogenase [Streptosporangium becharense]MBB5823734.1 D-amino-acid dehydrogenase [Streptosporangium becharense]